MSVDLGSASVKAS